MEFPSVAPSWQTTSHVRIGLQSSVDALHRRWNVGVMFVNRKGRVRFVRIANCKSAACGSDNSPSVCCFERVLGLESAILCFFMLPYTVDLA
jgi:hypothetical protein